MPVGRGDGIKSAGVRERKNIFSPTVLSTTPTHGYFVHSPVSQVPRDQGGRPSDSTIDICQIARKNRGRSPVLVNSDPEIN